MPTKTYTTKDFDRKIWSSSVGCITSDLGVWSGHLSAAQLTAISLVTGDDLRIACPGFTDIYSVVVNYPDANGLLKTIGTVTVTPGSGTVVLGNPIGAGAETIMFTIVGKFG